MFKKRGEVLKMNKIQFDILKYLSQNTYESQRELSKVLEYSLGNINQNLNELVQEEYLMKNYTLTVKAQQILDSRSPKRAIILAAGFGMRMVPINTETSKGLLEVRGEVLIERTIRQLQEVGIKDIYIVVGFMKEQYEYLIDKYQVELIVNNDYHWKNNLSSLAKAEKYIDNTYVIPCDIWCHSNPFSKIEAYSWYMLGNRLTHGSTVIANKSMEILPRPAKRMGNEMIGIAYITKDVEAKLKENLIKLSNHERYDNEFWETALYDSRKMMVCAKLVNSEEFIEINTYEQLREFDEDSNHLKTDAIEVIKQAFEVQADEITNIRVLKKGMTNRSFLFQCKGKEYIMRIPGEGTDQLINRRQEAAVYHAIADKNIADHVVYINPENGYKITEFIGNTKVCNSRKVEDVRQCILKLREFHQQAIQVEHEFDLFGQIEFYEQLWQGNPSVFRDYKETKKNIYELKTFVDKQKIQKVLTHIDAVPDNFLMVENDGEISEIKLIDWEYAGMQDPHLDIAMFCIYALYDREKIDRVIDFYFDYQVDKNVRLKIYSYIAIAGLLWSNWCEYKRMLGVEFSEYALRQYRYAKEYYRIVMQEMEEENV